MTGDIRAGDRRADDGLVLPRIMPELLYGALVSASVLAVSSVDGPTSRHVATTIVLVVAIYWLAHVYRDASGVGDEDREGSTPDRVRRALRTNNPILIGSLGPILMFTVGLMLGLSVPASVWFALVYTAALLAGASAYAAHQAGIRGRALAIQMIIGGSFGLPMIVLHYLLH
ncbi:hypothetical protein [Microlunatus ginsengisoli]|uniref:UbiA prenyltransferase family protein n=1 Tax=Microlunatus ginsengisoli TaxID=363863 RepID=A0ABP6ZGJ9_9ACTN